MIDPPLSRADTHRTGREGGVPIKKMSQCVPSWDADDPPSASPGLPHTTSTPIDVHDSWLDYEVAELIWVNGQPRVVSKAPISSPSSLYPGLWGDVDPFGATLVDQATGALPPCAKDDDLVPWLAAAGSYAAAATTETPLMDALVPGFEDNDSTHVARVPTEGAEPITIPSSTRKRSRSTADEGHANCNATGKAEKRSCGRPTPIVIGKQDPQASSCRRTQEGEDKCEKGRKQGDAGRCSISTKRSRAAADHNLSERRRRDKFNQKLKTLKKLVPGSSKNDKASILDEVIKHMRQLQSQMQMMMHNLPNILMHQFQMILMAQMAQMTRMGMTMGMMDENPVAVPLPPRPGVPPMPLPPPPNVFQPSTFLPVAGPWTGIGDAASGAGGVVAPDPFLSLLATQSQINPMSMEAWNKAYPPGSQQAVPRNPNTKP